MAILLAVAVGALAVFPRGEVHRCLRIGVTLPPTHSCCPEAKVERDGVPTTIAEPCCESVPGALGIAQLPPERDEAGIPAPALVQATTVAREFLPRTFIRGRSHRDRGRPPPGDQLIRLSTVLRV